jgi:hypothetical protein
LKEGIVAAYAVQGRRPRMEDRFVVNEDINKTGVSLFAVFDGHGGEVKYLKFTYTDLKGSIRYIYKLKKY